MTLRITINKKRMLIALPFVVLAMAGTAYAAWTIYTGLTGSASGSYNTAPTLKAFTFSDYTLNGANQKDVPCTAGVGASCTGGTNGTINYQIVNADPTNAHTWTTPGVTFSTSDDATDNCSAHLFLAPSNTYPTTAVAAGATKTGLVTFVSDPTTPVGCSNATITVAFTGSTTP